MKTITLGQVPSDQQIRELRDVYVAEVNAGRTPNKAIMQWLNARPELLAELDRAEIVPSYFALIVEYVFSKTQNE